MAILTVKAGLPYQAVPTDQIIQCKLNMRATVGAPGGTTKLYNQSMQFDLYNTGSPVSSLTALASTLQQSTSTPQPGWFYNLTQQLNANVSAVGGGLVLRNLMQPNADAYSYPSSLVGAIATQALPNSSCAFINFFTGAGSRGKMFLGPMSVADVTVGGNTCSDTLNSTKVTAFNACFTSLSGSYCGFTDSGGTVWQLVVNSLRGPAGSPGYDSQKRSKVNYTTNPPSFTSPLPGQAYPIIFLKPVTTWGVDAEISSRAGRKGLDRRPRGINRGGRGAIKNP